MPWQISRRGTKFCVVKTGESEPVPGGCHATKADALKHQRALYANEPNMTASTATPCYECEEIARPLIASRISPIPIAPPADWFDQPEPDHAEPLTVEADGRVHGHLAPWEGCHSGLVNGTARSCVKPPRSLTDYRMFHLGQLALDNGDTLPVGKIIVAGAHAPTTPGTSLQAATAHYDKTGSVGAFVRARNGKYGIWLSGSVRSDITPEQLRDLRANLPSGDWRNLNHNLELIGALSVPVPGYGIPAVVASAGGEIEALIMGYETEEAAVEDRDSTYVLNKRLIRESIEDPFGDGLTAATFSAEQRQRLAQTGAAMPDGSFPIRNCSDWDNARRAVGRAPASKRAAVKAHIAKRGRALGCSEGD